MVETQDLPFPKKRPRGRIDKSKLAMAEPERVRSKSHLAFVAKLPCAVPGCRMGQIQVHHLTIGPEPKARGIKASDRWCIPICVGHHVEIHANGETAFWAAQIIEPVELATSLWELRAVTEPQTKGKSDGKCK